MMIDIHTHILPAIDDGSQDMRQSLDQLKLMSKAGVSAVVLTPHYISNYYQNDPSKIAAATQKLAAAAEKANIPITLHQGAEILLDSLSTEKIIAEHFAINQTDYVLVESEMSSFPADLKQLLYDLVRAGYKPILAHPERYGDIKKNPALVEDLMYRNVYMQINAGSLLDHYGKDCRKIAWQLIQNGWAHFLASDNHCRMKEYSLPPAVELIRNNLDDYTADLLSKDNPRRLLDNEKIEMFYVSEIAQAERLSPLKKIKNYLGW
ncbi:MAG: CpsB/CapC family capsule biosynthesis tyrosine phosphatase [Candidatus Cloacimonadales bacterium]